MVVITVFGDKMEIILEISKVRVNVNFAVAQDDDNEQNLCIGFNNLYVVEVDEHASIDVKKTVKVFIIAVETDVFEVAV